MQSEIKNKIIASCEKNQILLSDNAINALCEYHLMLTLWNQKIDLTAVLNEDEMIARHYIDSLLPLNIKKFFPENINIIDVGTGAGLPGIPIAIARPDLQVTLIDAQRKRTDFLQLVKENLGLQNISIITGRAEDCSRQIMHREKYSIAMARALAPLPTLLEYLLPFVRIGGEALCWKGPMAYQEIQESEYAAGLLGGSIKAPLDLLAHTKKKNAQDEPERRALLVTCEKINATPDRYPRRAGIPSKRPLTAPANQ